jgi:hypothetical protein
MTSQTSPFTKEQLIPQEETLEVYKHKGQLFIGIPKETSYQEKRICLTPRCRCGDYRARAQDHDRIWCREICKVQR